jgi:hypothetical protein
MALPIRVSPPATYILDFRSIISPGNFEIEKLEFDHDF